jgi:hypothetical protein
MAMQAIAADPRLRTLPLAARMLWVLILEAMGADAVLPFASASRIALLVAAPETEVETQLQTLIAERLLAREGDTLVCPMLAAAATRADAARANGRRGGRPRAGESAAEARDRRQREMLMPMPAAAPEPSETQAAKPPPDDHDHYESLIEESSSHDARESSAEAAVRLAVRLTDLAGMDPARSSWDARTVQGWLAAGADAALCAEVVADVMTRAKRPPANLRYFDRPIQAAIAARRERQVIREERDRR